MTYNTSPDKNLPTKPELRHRIRQLMRLCLVTFASAIVLFSEFALSRAAPSWLCAISDEIDRTCNETQTQWMVVVCQGIYFMTFLFLEKRFTQNDRWWCIGNPNLWLGGLVMVAVVNYVLIHPNVQTGRHVIGLLAGIIIGLGVRTWVYRGDWYATRTETVQRLVLLTAVWVVLLGWTTVWQPDMRTGFLYRGEVRWTGAWQNPNTYGLLMGTGAMLGTGLFICGLKTQLVARRGKTALLSIASVATALCTIGVIKSYSRGAWLGVACGLAVLGYKSMQAIPNNNLMQKRWLHRNARMIALLVTSVLVLTFWLCRNTEWRPLRRALSIGNPNDFSWRNRVTTYEGALQMIKDKPLTGFADPNAAYEQLYSAVRLVSVGAFQSNDLFMLALHFGLPALFCFGASVGSYLASVRQRKPSSFAGQWVGNDLMLSSTTSTNQALTEPAFTAQILKISCCAGAVVMLTGFWFNDGLFELARGTVFWTLLILSWPRIGLTVNDHCSYKPHPSNRLFLYASVLTTVLSAIIWASARDPFRRITYSVPTPDGDRLRCMCVLPKLVRGPLPVVLFFHGAGGNLDNSGNVLRCIAELGIAAVGLEYNKTNQQRFNTQLRSLLTDLRHRPWARSNQVAWITHSLGAQRTLSFLVNYPELAPKAIVRLSGGWIPELEAMAKNTTQAGWSLKTQFWFVHGGQDEVFPVNEVSRLEKLLKLGGTHVRTDIFHAYGHDFGLDQKILWRTAAEYCALQFGQITPSRTISPPSLWYYWLPTGVLWIITVARHLLRTRKTTRDSPTQAVVLFAITAFAIATVVTAIHIVLPNLPVTSSTAKLARKLLVQRRLRDDFDWLTDQLKHDNLRIADVLEHIELGNLQRAFFKPQLTDDLYRNWVLSPAPVEEIGSNNWRRPLWEFFYPRIQHELDLHTAVRTVVRELRSRVTIVNQQQPAGTVLDAWHQQITTPAGFERLYIATLRAVGIPARLNENGKAEYWLAGEWYPAPRPMLEMIPLLTQN